jgi:creatinine amidohydrolase/Fe(II)-dependent formamide hydrolase-like protein
MTYKNNQYSLEGKMDDWGPFGNNEGKWLIFSIGNPVEGHGYALPRNIDDLLAQRIAHLVSCKTGARYVAHIPWTTDWADPAARDWAPKFIPVKELVEKLINFIQYHLEIYKEMNLYTPKILIQSGHGGNNPLAKYTEEIKQALNLEKLIIAKLDDIKNDTNKIMELMQQLTSDLASKGGDRRQIAKDISSILLSVGHAGHMEHSIGAALGVLDEKKLKIMNDELERDFEAALEKWPPLGGLGGYLLKGGKYIEVFGSEKKDSHGLWKCLKTLRELDNGKIKPIKELGEAIINVLADYYSQMLLNE